LGANWGDDGYFYVSYYDSKIGKENHVFSNAQSTTNYYRVYQYDPLGWVNSLGYERNSAWFGNIFTAMGDELLKAVSFYVASPNSSYEIYVYLDADSGPTSGSLSTTQTGTIVFPGYHTVHLDHPTIITLKQKFSVLVKLTTPGYNYPIPIEYPIMGYSSQANGNAGESYISSDGVTWEDLTNSMSNANACLKAFTVYVNPSPDFDGDGNTDVATYDVANGWWFLHNSGDSNYVFDAIGMEDGSRWKPVIGDYDGDGKTDVAVYDGQDGWWFFHYSSGGYFYDHIGQGGPGYAAVPGDYDGDWVTDIAVYDETNGNWFIKNSQGDYGFDSLGGTGWVAVPADYDGDGKTDVAVYNVAEGWWYLHYSNDGSYVFDAIGVGGGSRWEPVPGDYEGDGKTDVGVYDSEYGWWLFHYSSGGYFYDHIGQGGTGFAAVPGDYDGDGITDLAVYDETNGYWFIKSSKGDYGFDSLGGTGWIPVNLPYLFGLAF
jgi:hypothetical protein